MSMMSQFLALLASVCALSACGGGGDIAAAVAEPVAQTSATESSNNDSGTAGAGDSEAADETANPSVSTAGVLCNLEIMSLNTQASLNYTSEAVWSCSGDTRELVANGIPDHEVGSFPNPANPNTITEQTVRESFTLTPEPTGGIRQMGGPQGAVAYALNGVKVDANTAGSCDSSGNCSLIDPEGGWSIEALGQDSFDFGTDTNNAHVQPSGAYHYHGMPEGVLAARVGDTTDMVLVAWAADGFPVYARYGYADPMDADSAVVTVSGSYRLITSVPTNRPSVDLYALGTFAEDWVFEEGLGDLDACNGRFGVTPEFPEGIYHYYATDTYPYFQRCVTGSL